jgi:hypothetical protein
MFLVGFEAGGRVPGAKEGRYPLLQKMESVLQPPERPKLCPHTLSFSETGVRLMSYRTKIINVLF